MRKSLLECSDEELLGIVGDYALRLEYGSEPPSDKEQCEAGRWWFDAQINKTDYNYYRKLAKSSIFINGVLDRLVKQYRKDEKLNKAGRGLIE